MQRQIVNTTWLNLHIETSIFMRKHFLVFFPRWDLQTCLFLQLLLSTKLVTCLNSFQNPNFSPNMPFMQHVPSRPECGIHFYMNPVTIMDLAQLTAPVWWVFSVLEWVLSPSHKQNKVPLPCEYQVCKGLWSLGTPRYRCASYTRYENVGDRFAQSRMEQDQWRW